MRGGVGTEPDPDLGRRKYPLGIADGADTVRLRSADHEGQIRPDADLQLLRRRDFLVNQPPRALTGARAIGAPVVASTDTFLAKIRFFPPALAPTLAEVAHWCGAELKPGVDPFR